MTRQHDPSYKALLDRYDAFRCVNCSHLRYANDRPGDPCQVCPCQVHVLPDEVREAGERP